ncbi:YhgE/Pip family protein [Microbacterium sp. YMB-B2]|uniref:YhgE/Pip family protein n=1 Tax=Microbacterium tenebrionis TaxID=2830665 RepID=A0A9X1LR46_9MICO|nr:YhgE/Pip family protein [Microbacterium tenebrionis]MCC2030216.1 YhgE/Pip family protein [Microbacterium tenebrionis]
MTLSIERARSRKPITVLTILGVLLLPAVIGGILVAALQNPTERLDTMTAAIVNNDEPVTIDDQYTPLGRQLAAGLVEGSDDMESNLTWVISNEEDAADGLADGSYQAVVTIPSQFSAAATSAGQRISSGSGTAEQATIQVTTPDDGLVADDLITSQIATVAASSMSTMLSEATTENILVGFTTIGDQIGEAANGADELANGARSAADGAAELPSGATQLADGAAQLGSGASELANGLGTIASGTRDAANGAAELGGGLTSGASALEQSGLVPDQLFTAAIGSQQATAGVKGGVDDLAAGMNRLLAACVGREEIDPVCIGLADMAAAMPELQGAADMASQAAAGTATGLNAFDTQATQTMAGQLRTAGQGAFDLSNGLNQLAGGVDQSAAGASALGTGATQLSDGATALADGAGELATGLDDLADGNEELASGLHQAADQLPSFSDQESTSLASVIADPVTSNAEANTIFGPTAIPLLAAVVLWFGGLASFLVMRAHTARTLTSRRSSAWLTLGGFWPAAAIGAGQGVLVALIVQIVASYDAATWWAFAGTAVLAGIAFAAVNQALVAVFGGAGRWVSALIGVVAIATGLISTVPDWLSSIGAMLPTAPAVTGLIAANGSAVAGLIAWGVLSLIVTTITVALRRTTSAKAVLASA